MTTGLIAFCSQFFARANPHVDRCSNPLPWDPLSSPQIVVAARGRGCQPFGQRRTRGLPLLVRDGDGRAMDGHGAGVDRSGWVAPQFPARCARGHNLMRGLDGDRDPRAMMLSVPLQLPQYVRITAHSLAYPPARSRTSARAWAVTGSRSTAALGTDPWSHSVRRPWHEFEASSIVHDGQHGIALFRSDVHEFSRSLNADLYINIPYSL